MKKIIYFLYLIFMILNSKDVTAEKFDVREHIELHIKDQGLDGNCFVTAPIYAAEIYLNYVKNLNTELSIDVLEFSIEFPYYNRYNGGNQNIIISTLANGNGLKNKTFEYMPGLDENEYNKLKSTTDLEPDYMATEIVKLKTIDEIKEHIKKYGAAVSNIYHSIETKNKFPYEHSKYFNKENSSYFAPPNDPAYKGFANHMIAIIGFDDDFDKTKFTTQPTHNGAFICVDAQGKIFGDNGVYYVSYESLDFAREVYGFKEIIKKQEIISNDRQAYSHYLENMNNDPSSDGYFAIFNEEATIDKIGFFTNEDNVDVIIRFLPNSEVENIEKSDDPISILENAKILYKGSVEKSGYHTVDIDEIKLKDKTAFHLYIDGTNKTYVAEKYSPNSKIKTKNRELKHTTAIIDNDEFIYLSDLRDNSILPLKLYKKSEDDNREVVEIPDERLKRAIICVLDNMAPKSGVMKEEEFEKIKLRDIYKDELEELKKLNFNFIPFKYRYNLDEHKQAVSRGIQNINGLEYAINLEELHLSENSIEDFSPIYNLNKLKILEIDRNFAHNIDGIYNLTNLEILNIYNLELSNLDGIEKLINLKSLDFHFNNQKNPITDISPLAKLEKLEYLNIESNAITDISALKNLSNLNNLGLGNNFIYDFTPVKKYIEDTTEYLKEFDFANHYFGSANQTIKKDIIKYEYKDGKYYIDDPVKGFEPIKGLLKEMYDVDTPIVNYSENKYYKIEYDYTNNQIIIIPNEDKTKIAIASFKLSYDMYNFTFENFDLTKNNKEDEDDKEERKPVIFEDPILKNRLLTLFKNYNGDDRLDEIIEGEYEFKLSDPNYRKNPEDIEIYEDEMELIEALALRGFDEDFNPIEFQSIKGLESATNIKQLTISSGNIPEEGAIRYSENSISDLNALKNLNNLEILRLSHNNIEDITPLENLTNLKELYLSHNKISDISPLKKLHNLKIFDISLNYISDIDVIKNYSILEKFIAKRNEISEINAIQNLVNLYKIDLEKNQIKDIKPLENINKIIDLNLKSNNISDISVLTNKGNITTLYLGNNFIDDLSSIHDLNNISILDISNNYFTDINNIENLLKLYELNISYNNLKDIYLIRNFKNLEFLDISNNNITDISPIKDLKNLSILKASNNQINDFSPLDNINIYNIQIDNQYLKKDIFLNNDKTLDLNKYLTLSKMFTDIKLNNKDINFDGENKIIYFTENEFTQNNKTSIIITYNYPLDISGDLHIYIPNIYLKNEEENTDEEFFQPYIPEDTIEDRPIEWNNDQVVVKPQEPKENKEETKPEEIKPEEIITVPEKTISITFKDIENVENKEEIQDLAQRGILKGDDLGNFNPDEKVTRAMLVETLYRISKDKTKDVNKNYVDVKTSDWYYESMKWATSQGIIQGNDNNEAMPNKELTREELAVIIARFIKEIPFEIKKAFTYQDGNEISDWAKAAIKEMDEKGIIDSTHNSPKEGVTRKELAHTLYVIIQRVLELSK